MVHDVIIQDQGAMFQWHHPQLNLPLGGDKVGEEQFGCWHTKFFWYVNVVTELSEVQKACTAIAKGF